MARLKVKESVLKRLFAMSGNLCAHPKCNRPLYAGNGTGYVNVCHIAPAEANWFRHDPNLDDEALRAIDNLILLCVIHHGEIDQEASQETTAVIKQWKAAHEAKYTDMQLLFGNTIIDRLSDRRPIAPQNLMRLMDLAPGEYQPADLLELKPGLARFMERIANVPPPTMEFTIKTVTHGLRGAHRGGLGIDGIHVSAHEIADVLDLGPAEITRHCGVLDHYGLGYLQEEHPPTICIARPDDLMSWTVLRDAAANAHVDLETLLQAQDFSIFDR